MRFVFRHFVTPARQPQGQHAAEAAEAAASQGRFWEMHNTLIAHEGALDNGHIVEYAAALGLDMPRFLRDVTGHVHAARVREDYDSGIRSGVDAAPAFFINEIRHDGPCNPEALMAALQEALSLRAS
jgi:protein-disulfide isomerase